MLRVALALSLLGFFTTYFYKVERQHIHNNLACTFILQPTEQIKQNRLTKLKGMLPLQFPMARFEYIEKKIVSSSETTVLNQCEQHQDSEFQNSIFYSYRQQLYPIYIGSSQIFDSLLLAQKKEAIILNQLKEFKSILEHENESFSKFIQDCLRIKELVAQTELLGHHLRIDPNKKLLAGTPPKESVAARMKKNVTRQIAFAKRHLHDNEKMFRAKWKKFFDFSTEGQLCAR
ncbi:MAG: hypothetical protein JNL11_14700 [Bdellovibrionaceae bacterium]|nr:hypothetical protein [Pseudobdellovibrionaceae bacterium]